MSTEVTSLLFLTHLTPYSPNIGILQASSDWEFSPSSAGSVRKFFLIFCLLAILFNNIFKYVLGVVLFLSLFSGTH